MKFSGKMCLKMILKVTKKQGFNPYLEGTFFEKPQGGSNWPLSSGFRVKTNWSCIIFAHFSNTFVSLPPLNFSTSALRVSIGIWQLTILSILKSISARSFLILSSFSFSYVYDVCTSFSCCIVSSVLPMYLGSCTGSALVVSHGSFGWSVDSWSFIKFALIWSMGEVSLKLECQQTVMSSFCLL